MFVGRVSANACNSEICSRHVFGLCVGVLSDLSKFIRIHFKRCTASGMMQSSRPDNLAVIGTSFPTNTNCLCSSDLTGLVPGDMLANLFQVVPELCSFANLDLQVSIPSS